MLNKIKKDNKGFTIIEVLIVLAIAGLILLVVFLAVPALQRSSRNTQLKNGASAVLAGVSEFVSNNDGKLPTEIEANDTGTVTISGTDGSTQSTVKVKSGLTAGVNDNDQDINIQLKKKCPDTEDSRSYSAVIKLETGSGNTNNSCIDG